MSDNFAQRIGFFTDDAQDDFPPADDSDRIYSFYTDDDGFYTNGKKGDVFF